MRHGFVNLCHQQLQIPFVNRCRIISDQKCIKVRNIIFVCDTQCLFMNVVDLVIKMSVTKHPHYGAVAELGYGKSLHDML